MANKCRIICDDNNKNTDSKDGGSSSKRSWRASDETDSQPNNGTASTFLFDPLLFQNENFNKQETSSRGPSRTAKLDHTTSFYHLLLSLNEPGHSITAAPRVHDDTVEIDKISPSEDDKFAEQMLYGCMSCTFLLAKFLSAASAPLGNTNLDRPSYESHAIQPQLKSNDEASTSSRQLSHSLSGNPATATQAAEDIVTAHSGQQDVPLPTQVTAPPQEVPSAAVTGNEGHAVTDTSKPVSPKQKGQNLGNFNTITPPPAISWSMHPAFNTKAVKYINELEAITEHCDRCLQVSDDLFLQLWEDLGNWHSTLRKKAHMFIAQCYHWDPKGRHDVNIEIAKSLLDNGGLFLKNVVDDKIRVLNCDRLVIDFFYTGSASVGQLFPEVFLQEVLRVVVALTMTALKVVLDEIISGKGKIDFRGATYSLVYVKILGQINKYDILVAMHDDALGSLLHIVNVIWSWTTKAGPNMGKSFSVPTIPILCGNSATKSLRWTVSLFHSFKLHLHPKAFDQESS
ncbi:hypothetical protein OG21DRAFT_1527009 [Imleria badia]|nr:hypothetical protein OG21DRAFT_1527009 [Imleria badia]